MKINQHAFYLQIDYDFMPPNKLYGFFSVIYYTTALNFFEETCKQHT